MSMSMYGASVPLFRKTLANLAHILSKAEADTAARKFDPAALTQFRLAPDMLPFTAQVRIACDAAKLCVARLSGIDAPKFDDTEQTLPELRDRIAKTLAYLEAVSPAAVDGTELKELVIPAGRDRTRNMTGEDYLRHWALPNFFFHVTMAYAILRHNGVPLGKSDYLAGATA
jgi:hypothetical protein